MLNVPVNAPAATIIVEGTEALLLSEDKLTEKPPEGAACERVTVPTEDVPPTTWLGFTVRLNTETAV